MSPRNTLEDAEEVLAVAPAVACLFVAFVVVPDDVYRSRNAVFVFPFFNSPNEMAIVAVVRVDRSEDDVSC